MHRLSPTLSAEHRVPVTAKLSKRFYDVLGEDVANELVDWFNAVDLTYRADLRELNELNFARFDAKLEQRLAELRAEVRQEIAQLRGDLLRWMFGFWVTTTMAWGGPDRCAAEPLTAHPIRAAGVERRASPTDLPPADTLPPHPRTSPPH